MRKWGTALHILITAGVGILFFAIGELLFLLFNEVIWVPLGIALYFLLFAAIIYVTMRLLNKWRGDYSGWSKKNLGSVVNASFKKGAIALIVIFVAAGIFEFVYELESFKFVSSKASSYIFVIDDSGSMEVTDPSMKRVDAISEIMEGEDKDFEFAIYRFTHEVEKIREMAPYQQGETFAFAPTGGTDIVAALKMAVDDIKSGATNAGSAPRILLLSDGESPDNGLSAVLSDCAANRIVVSTILFDDGSFSFGSDMLKKIAAQTGGVYSEVRDANLLSEEMHTAITTTSTRNLLSDRFVFTNDWVYMILRILFLTLLGAAFSWLKQKCYCSAYDHGYADKVFFMSIILCTVAAILVEVLFKTELLPAPVIRLIFCAMWAMCPGFFLQGCDTVTSSANQFSVYNKGY